MLHNALKERISRLQHVACLALKSTIFELSGDNAAVSMNELTLFHQTKLERALELRSIGIYSQSTLAMRTTVDVETLKRFEPLICSSSPRAVSIGQIMPPDSG